MSDCLFCRIVAGEIPSQTVLDGERVYAFRDINPQAPTHVLVIPKEHVVDVTDIRPEHGPLLAEIMAATTEIARQEGVDGSGFRVVANVGADAGQTVHHLHFHVLGGRPLAWPPG